MANHERSLFESVRYVAGVSLLWAGLGAAAGAATDLIVNYNVNQPFENEYGVDSQQELDNLIVEVNNYETSLNNAEVRTENLEDKYGETCLTAMKPYTVGHSLQSTNENDVINDLKDAEGQPCGSGSTELREAIHEIRETKSKLAELKKYDYNANLGVVKSIEEAIEKKNKDADVWLASLVCGGLGLSLSLLSSIISERELRMYKTKYHSSGLLTLINRDFGAFGE